MLHAALLPALLASGWCDALGAVLDEPNAGARETDSERANAAHVAQLERAIATLPQSAQPVAGQVRGLLGNDGGLGEARAALEGIRRDGCATPTAHAGAPATEVAALIEGDARFGGVRVGDDVIDRLLDRLGRWLTAIFEGEGMRRYAGAVRIVYLVGLALAVIGVAVWLVRARRRLGQLDEQTHADARARVERARVQQAAELFGQAEARLDDDPHRAAALVFAALLARVGEHAPGAVSPARTGREVMARLDGGRARAIEAPLSLFDRVYFGRVTTAEDARALLASARAAETALASATTTGTL